MKMRLCFPFPKLSTRIIPLLLTGLVLSVCFTSCRRPESDEEMVSEHVMPNVVQLSPQAVQAAHLAQAIVTVRQESVPLAATAVVKANENQLFHINSFVSGRVIREAVGLGDPVRAGQTLAVIQNLEVAKIQANYIHELHSNEIEVEQAKTRYSLAKSRMEREQELFSEGISPRADYQQAKADAELAKTDYQGRLEHRTHLKNEAKALLSAYGVRPNRTNAEKISTSSPIVAPNGGVVLRKNVTVGDMVSPETVMYEVADLSQVWLDVTVFPKDIARIRSGQSLKFTTDSLPGRVFPGRIDYVQPAVQENSQTYIARAYLRNPHTLLKPGILGQVRIEQNLSRALVVVPESAVQRYGREAFVFVPLTATRFQKRTVVLGDKVRDGYAVLEGLSSGATVVTQGSFTLKAELLKSQFEEAE
jgi:membrane fusion protein, heavy metal efflux system